MADATTATAVTDPQGPAGPIAGTRLSVTHRTAFHYGLPVTRSVNTVRMEPRTFPYQKTLSALIRVIPATRLRCFTDLFQNITHHFELPDPHSKLEIESRIRVHNLPLAIPDFAFTATAAEYRDPAIHELVWVYLQDSRRVSRSPEVWRHAVDTTVGMESVFDKARAIMGWIHREFSYQPGATGVRAHLEESLAIRSGVCQDFTHVMLGMCRSVGIPARYASGYLYNGPTDQLVGAQASHAWCEVYLPSAGWIGFDPTNDNLADDRYVKVAVGRDYEDVAPVEGSYLGIGHCRLEVSVVVEKI
jgi:transglutaminase-like putative cysteine protease